MKYAFIGHTVGVKLCLEKAMELGVEVAGVWTHPKTDHAADLEIFEKRADHFGDFAYDVFDITNGYGVPLHEYEDLNSQETIDQIKSSGVNVIVTIGCRDILKDNFISSFEYLFNLHPFNLPYFRGAGIDSWYILQGHSGSDQKAIAHQIAHRIDAGKVLATAEYHIDSDARPLDIFKARIVKLPELFESVVDKLKASDFDGPQQDESVSAYYPRLNTDRDGRLDIYEWDRSELELFVRAFSYPYKGAWIEYLDQKIHIHDIRFHDATPHPFSYGLVFRKSDSSLFCYAPGSIVELSTLEQDYNPFDPSGLKIGKYILR